MVGHMKRCLLRSSVVVVISSVAGWTKRINHGHLLHLLSEIDMETSFFTVRIDPLNMGLLHNFYQTSSWSEMLQSMELIALMGPDDEMYKDMWIRV